jgi:hypothetical protein
MALLLESVQIVPAFRPVDLQAGANTGDWVSLENYKHVAVVFHSAIGAGGDDITLTVEQATSAAGAGNKALNISSSKAFKKQAATSLAAVGTWSDASADLSTNTWTNATSAEEETLVVLEFDADELDVDGGFTFIQCSGDDVGSNAQLGACYYILSEPRFPSAPTSMLSAIA